MNTKAVSQKSALTLDNLRLVCDRFKHTISHDDLLFVALLSTGFHGLLRLGELTLLDNSSIRDWRKVTRRQSLVQCQNEFEFLLPAHKADQFFEGNQILIHVFSSSFDPVPIFFRYLFLCDRLFPAATPLWLTSKGEVPSRSFFLSRFHIYFPKHLVVLPCDLGVPLFLRSSKHPTTSSVQLVAGPRTLGSSIIVFILLYYTLCYTTASFSLLLFSLFFFLVTPLIACHHYPVSSKKKKIVLIATTCTRNLYTTQCISFWAPIWLRVTWVVRLLLSASG